jgi:hypothetical protein
MKLPKQALAQQYRKNLPKKPYCTDDFSKGVKIRSKVKALLHKYLQYQNPNEMLWLVFDVDYVINHEIIRNDLKLPPPNILVQNRDNGHGHLYYLMANPVHLNPDSSQKAMDYLLAVQRAMTRELSADPGYAGLLAKNPLDDENWCVAYLHVAYLHDKGYELDELADYLHTLNDRDAQEAIDQGIGFGRNVALFNGTRKWAYVELRKYTQTNRQTWFEAVLVEAALNNRFDPPLYEMEVRSIAKSISNWTWIRRRNLTDFSKQSARGKKRAETTDMKALGSKGGRKSKRDKLLPEALRLKSQGHSYRMISKNLGVSIGTISNWLKAPSN